MAFRSLKPGSNSSKNAQLCNVYLSIIASTLASLNHGIQLLDELEFTTENRVLIVWVKPIKVTIEMNKHLQPNEKSSSASEGNK